MRYDPTEAASFYDAYGEREWTRFADGRTSAVSVHVHRHYLERFISAGDLVLDIGAGPGRFTIELARLGARVVVADISPGQLDLNRAKVAEAGVEASVVERVVADIVDLRQFDSASFDAVVCFGGPLSYVMERADDAIAELLRITRPGGHVLLSVMSLVGATALAIEHVVGDVERFGIAVVDDVIRSGDLPSELSGGHLPMHMFRWSELKALLERHPCSIVAASAASIGTPRDQAMVASLDNVQLEALIGWEIDLAAEPGAIASGAHLIAVVRKDGSDETGETRGRAVGPAAAEPARAAAVDAPILDFDPAREAIVEAANVPYIAKRHGTRAAMPPRVVLCFFQEVIEKIVRERSVEPFTTLRSEIGPNHVYVLDGPVPVVVAHPGVGAPLAAAFMEELIGLGGRVFIGVGGAGTLIPDLTLGHAIVPTSAIRDEGTSYHYLPPSREVSPTPSVVAAILAELRGTGVPYVTGKTWTTDAIFRETRAKAARRVAEGCICVEMEAAACCAVATFRGVRFGQILYAGDDLSGAAWDDRGWISHTTGREALFRIAVAAIARVEPGELASATARIRLATREDLSFLAEMLVCAAFPPWLDPPPSPAAALADPVAGRYLRDWGRDSDVAVCAEDESGRPVGAAWYRRLTATEPGHGFVAEDVPEIAIAVEAASRGRGIGSRLLAELVAVARASDERALSLSVSAANPIALRLYEGAGFARVGGTDDHPTMLLSLD